MSPLRNANSAVVRFRQVQVLSLAVRMLVLFVGLYLVLTYVKGV